MPRVRTPEPRPIAAGGFLLWVLAVLVLGACGSQSESERSASNLIIVSLDTLRADRLGCYGHDRPTSPTLDALAAKGTRFTHAFAESSWTLPSHMTLFTGWLPGQHGVTRKLHRLSNEVPTLAAILREHGFRTFAYTAGGLVGARFGFARGFETYFESTPSLSAALARARNRIERLAQGERFFAFVHSYDIHCPYDPPPRYAQLFRRAREEDRIETRGRCGNPHFNAMNLTPGQVGFLSDQYDASIRRADDALASFLDSSVYRERRDDTIVVTLSDHGEEFMEHGRIGHERTLHREVLAIPLIIVAPGYPPGVVEEPAGLVDVMPTLLDLLGVPAPANAGRSFAHRVRGEADPAPIRPAFAELDYRKALRSVILEDQHLILDRETGAQALYDLEADPGERRNLLEADPGRGIALRRILDAHLETLEPVAEPARVELTPQERIQLRELGYLD